MRILKIIVGCEYSGVVRRALRSLGHHAWSCDLLPAEDKSKHHIQCDLLELLDIDRNWDMGIFFPPCTYLCSSGMHWTTRGLRDPKLTDDAIKFVETLWDAPIKHIAIENPVGALSTRSKLGKPAQTINPYEFGEDASKRTCLWLKNLPPLVKDPAMRIPGRIVNGKERWGNQTDSGQNRLGPSESRGLDRAKTYPGIAEQMAKQWTKHIIEST